MWDSYKFGPWPNRINVLEMANEAISTQNLPKLAAISEETFCFDNSDLGPLIVIGKRLTKNPEFLPQAVKAFEYAVCFDESADHKLRQQAIACIFDYVESLKNPQDRFNAYGCVVGHTPSGSEDRQKAEDGFFNTIEGPC